MTPAEFLDLCERIADALRSRPDVSDVTIIVVPDDRGSEPEIALVIGGHELVLTVGSL